MHTTPDACEPDKMLVVVMVVVMVANVSECEECEESVTMMISRDLQITTWDYNSLKIARFNMMSELNYKLLHTTQNIILTPRHPSFSKKQKQLYASRSKYCSE